MTNDKELFTQKWVADENKQHYCHMEFDRGGEHNCYEFSLEELHAFANAAGHAAIAARDKELLAGVEPESFISSIWDNDKQDYIPGPRCVTLDSCKQALAAAVLRAEKPKEPYAWAQHYKDRTGFVTTKLFFISDIDPTKHHWTDDVSWEYLYK